MKRDITDTRGLIPSPVSHPHLLVRKETYTTWWQRLHHSLFKLFQCSVMYYSVKGRSAFIYAAQVPSALHVNHGLWLNKVMCNKLRQSAQIFTVGAHYIMHTSDWLGQHTKHSASRGLTQEISPSAAWIQCFLFTVFTSSPHPVLVMQKKSSNCFLILMVRFFF